MIDLNQSTLLTMSRKARNVVSQYQICQTLNPLCI